MAKLTQSNSDNFLTWQKVNGGLALTRLQARGIPGCFEGYNLGDITLKDTLSFGAGNTLRGLWWSSDGFDFYYTVSGSSLITQKTVSTPFNINTVAATTTKDVSAQDTNPMDVKLSADGTKMYFLGTENENVYQYSLSTAYNVSTASYDSKALAYNGQTASGTGFAISDDSIYLTGGATIYQYSWTPGDMATAAFVRSLTITGATFYTIFYRDQEKLYLSETGSELVYELSMSGGSLLRATITDMATVATNPYGLFFDEGGFNMWILDGSDNINEYWVGCP